METFLSPETFFILTLFSAFNLAGFGLSLPLFLTLLNGDIFSILPQGTHAGFAGVRGSRF